MSFIVNNIYKLLGGKIMKKILSILLLGVLAMNLTGCAATEEQESNQTLVCTTTETDDDMKIEQVISMTYQNDKLKHMTLAVNTTIANQSAAETGKPLKHI